MYQVTTETRTTTTINPMKLQFQIGPLIIQNNTVPKPDLNLFNQQKDFMAATRHINKVHLIA